MRQCQKLTEAGRELIDIIEKAPGDAFLSGPVKAWKRLFVDSQTFAKAKSTIEEAEKTIENSGRCPFFQVSNLVFLTSYGPKQCIDQDLYQNLLARMPEQCGDEEKQGFPQCLYHCRVGLLRPFASHQSSG